MASWKDFIDAITNFKLFELKSLIEKINQIGPLIHIGDNITINVGDLHGVTPETVRDAKENTDRLSEPLLDAIKDKTIEQYENKPALEKWLEDIDKSDVPTFVNTVVVGSTLSSWEDVREYGEDFSPNVLNPDVFFKLTNIFKCKNCHQHFTKSIISTGGVVEVGGAQHRCPHCGHEDIYHPKDSPSIG